MADRLGEYRANGEPTFLPDKADIALGRFLDRFFAFCDRLDERKLAVNPQEKLVAATRIVRSAGSVGLQGIRLLPHVREIWNSIEEDI